MKGTWLVNEERAIERAKPEGLARTMAILKRLALRTRESMLPKSLLGKPAVCERRCEYRHILADKKSTRARSAADDAAGHRRLGGSGGVFFGEAVFHAVGFPPSTTTV
jgi:hypothetical protein